jgi:hypothetical protein
MNVQLDLLRATAEVKRAAREQRELGRRRAAEKAEERCDGWTRRAGEFLGRYAREIAHGQPFLVENAVIVAPYELRPLEPRAWGGALIYAKGNASRPALLVPATHADGTRIYDIGSKNKSPKPMWRAA